MSQRAILGIMGKKGTGKTEVSEYLVKHYGFVEKAFGDKLKAVVADLFDIPWVDLYARDGKNTFDDRWQMTHRQLLQRFGTEVGRAVNPYVWVYHVRKWIESGAGFDAVISDVRFKTEVEMIRDVGGRVWKIARDTGDNAFMNHASETEQDEIEPDVTIFNCGTIDELHFMIDEAVKREFSWKRKR